jgi:predicted transposase YbfD/YdcC
VLAVKDNQPTLHAAVHEHFLHLHDTDFVGAECQHRVTRNASHGRKEERHYYLSPVPRTMRRHQTEWAGLQSVGQAIATVNRDGQESSEVRYYICSFKPGMKRFAAAVRGHWGIENSLHWVLDVTFDEDRSRIRKDHGPENFALLRRMATTLIQRDPSPGSVRRKRKRAAWSEESLLNTLRGGS